LTNLKCGCALLFLVTATCCLASPEPLSYSFLEDQTEGEFSVRATLTGVPTWPGSALAEIVFDYRDAGNYLAAQLHRDGVGFVKVASGKEHRWGDLVDWKPPAGQPLHLTLQRRDWRIALLADGKVIARAYEHEVAGGRVGTGVRGAGLRWSDVQVQPVEPVHFEDDFTRVSGQGGQWETLAGQFGIKRSKTVQFKVEETANPFSFGARATDVALTAAGYWFYDSYRASVSVRPADAGAVGLAAYVQDAGNYLLFRLASGEGGETARQLVEVRDGRRKVLASAPGGYAVEQWYRLAIEVCEGRCTALVDGVPALTARPDAFGQGRFGLFADHCADAQFDDVLVEPAPGFAEDFSVRSVGKWRDVGGRWVTQHAGSAAFRRKLDPGASLSVGGSPDWRDYEYSARVTPGDTAGIGLCVGYRDERNYDLFRWGGASAATANQQQLVCVRDGQPTVLATTAAKLDRKRTYRVEVDAKRWRFHVSVDGHQVLDALDPGLTGGEVGFFGEGAAGARFTDAVVRFPGEEAPLPDVTEQFTREYTMNTWAAPESVWKRDAQGVTWHTGVFFGEPVVELPLPGAAKTEGTVRLCIHGDGQSLDSGYTVTARSPADGGRLQVSLQRAGTEVAKGEGSLQPGAVLRLSQSGPFVLVTLDDQLLTHFHDGDVLPGRRVGLNADWRGVGLQQVRAYSDHLLDNTFSSAPIHWWAGRGVWEVANRWPCSPGWSWFCGVQRGEPSSPVLWSKEAFVGDQVVEAFAAVKMDVMPDQGGYRHSSDVCLTLCGDGRDLSSGYSLIMGGRNNTATLFMRRETVLGEDPKLVFTKTDVRGLDATGLADFHRHWFHLRIEKSGGHLRAFVEGKLAFEHDDPQPLPGGQIALWTWNNGLMVARARAWYQTAAGWQACPVMPRAVSADGPSKWRTDAGPPVALVSGFESGLEGWTGKDRPEGALLSRDGSTAVEGRHSLRVRTAVSGGDLRVWAGVQRFDPAKFPRIAFSYRTGPDVKVNLVARALQENRPPTAN